MKALIIILIIMISSSNILYSADLDIIKDILAQGKTIIQEKMDAGLRIKGTLHCVNKHFDNKGWAPYLKIKGIKPMLRQDVEIFEEFSNSFQHNSTATEIVQNAISPALEDIYNPGNSMTWSMRSSCFRGIMAIGGFVDYPDKPSINRRWVIEKRVDQKIWENSLYSFINYLYAPYFNCKPFDINLTITRYGMKAADLFQRTLSDDNEKVIITAKNISFPERKSIRIVLLAKNPEKILSLELFHDDESLYLYDHFQYRSGGCIESIEEFEFNEEGIAKSSDDNIIEKSTRYQKILFDEYTENVKFPEEHFNPFTQIKDGDQVEDRVNGIYYIEGKKNSLVSLEEIKKTIVSD